MKPISQCKVLVVDDVQESLMIVGDILEDVCQVVPVPDGMHAVAAVLKEHPDLILLDVILPGMEGFSICQALKNNPDTSSIPVIFLTALSDSDDKLAGFEAGGVDYITKPFHAAELRARVRTHLRLSLLERDQRQHIDYLASALEHTEENFLFFAEHTADILLQADARGIIGLVNPTWTEVTGQNRSEVVGKFLRDIADGRDADALADALKRARAAKDVDVRTQFRIAATGGQRWMRAAFRLRYDASGEYLGLTGVLADISDLIAQNEELRASRDAAQGEAASHVEYLEKLAYGLRSPLNKICGGAEQLAESEPPGTRIGAVELIALGCRDINAFVEEMISRSRAKSNQPQLPPPLPHVAASRSFDGPVLLVDDDRSNLLILGHLLKRLGFRDVDLAGSAAAALPLWKERGHRLVFLDLIMPETDGYDLCRALRDAAGGDRPAILAVSASALPENATRCMEAGFDFQMAKPISLHGISEALGALGWKPDAHASSGSPPGSV